MIKYFDKGGKEVSEQQVVTLDSYYKETFENGIKLSEELFFNGEVYQICLFNHDGLNHENLYENVPHRAVLVLDLTYFQDGFVLHESTGYNFERIPDFIISKQLYDSEGNLIANLGYDSGIFTEDESFKEFWRKDIIEDRPVLRAVYNSDGSLKELITNMSLDIYIDDQDSIGYDDSPECIIALAQELEISEEYAAYFMTSQAIPDFLKAIN